MGKSKKRVKKVKKAEVRENRIISNFKSMSRLMKVMLIIFFSGSVIAGLVLINMVRIEQKYGDAWHIKAMDLDGAWWTSSGSGVTIAFLDTGMATELMELYGNRVKEPYNVITNSKNVDDPNGHGTKMICAATCRYKGTGVYGVAYNANVVPVVVADDSGRTSGEYLAKGIYYAIEKNVDIINISMGSRVENEQVKIAVELAHSKGILVVAASGDYRDDKILYPASYTSTISVSSQSKLGVKYKDASYNNTVDFLIPGEFIKTISFVNGEKTFSYESGSSVATALMTGAVALKYEKSFNKNYSDMMKNIRKFNQSSTFLNVSKFKGGGFNV